MTLAELQAILPYAHARAALYIVPLNAAMTAYEINTKPRQAAFIAQVGHESGQFRYVKEIASGVAYEMRRDLGNIEPGDGVKYKGRGLIQITGRSNYELVGKALCIPCLAHPELLEQPINACRSAAWWWKTHGLNELADANEFTAITKKINGGTNGLQDRMALYEKAQQILA